MLLEDKSWYIFYSLMAWGIYEIRKFREQLQNLESTSKDEILKLTKYYEIEKEEFKSTFEKMKNLLKILDKLNNIIK